MKLITPGHHKSHEAFAAHLARVAPELESEATLEGDAGPLGATWSTGGRHFHNRFAIHPMEGWDGTRDGRPTDWTLERWRKFGRSGASLIWGGEAFAVDPAGRANARQLAHFDAPSTRETLKDLLGALEEGMRDSGTTRESTLVGLQLTHSGRHSRPAGERAPLLGQRVDWLDLRTATPTDARVLNDEDLQALQARYVEVAVLAQEAGFDFVDVKACHGYLVHELLGSRGRLGRYGGGFEGRTRFLLETVEAIQSAAPSLTLGVRLCLGDVVPFEAGAPGEPGRPMPLPAELGFGWGVSLLDPLRPDPAEPLQLVGELLSRGVQLFNTTMGSPYTCPHIQRPAAVPPFDGYAPPEDPLQSVGQQLALTREVKRAHPEAIVVGTGYSYLQQWLPHVAQAELRRGEVDLVGLGRMVLSYPEMPLHVLLRQQLERKRICRTFSDCTNGPRSGLRSGCFPLDPLYRGSEEAETLRTLKAKMRSDEP